MEIAAEIICEIVLRLGFLLYGGPVVAFAVLIGLGDRLAHSAQVIRTWRSCGPGLGLALGMCIAGALGRHWLLHGAFVWTWASPAEQAELAGWLTFFLLWASNVKLEVWTLEPLRKLDGRGVTDGPEFTAARGSLARHLAVQATLAIAVVVLDAVWKSQLTA